jgi:DnaJ family protein C protein 8
MGSEAVKQEEEEKRFSGDDVSPPLPQVSKQEFDDIQVKQEEEEDPLVKAQRERDELEKALDEAKDVNASDDPAMKAFYSDMKEVDRENEVNRILGAFKLNPFEMLGLRFDAAPEDIPRQYRKVSLSVHPDKCTHPKAKDAFEIIGHAQKELKNEEKRNQLDFLLNVAKERVISDWKKAAKHDAASRLAAELSGEGVTSVLEKWMATDEFHEAWKLKAREVLAQSEWRKRKMTTRVSRIVFFLLLLFVQTCS